MTDKAKDITVIVVGSGKQYPVSVEQGVTVRELLAQLNLRGYLRRPNTVTTLNENEDLFGIIENGDKLEFVPGTPVAGTR